MFGKKKESLPDYNLHLLSSEYIVDGTVAGDTGLYFDNMEPFHLSGARLRSVRPGGGPDRTCSSYLMYGRQLVALVPEADYRLMADYDAWKMSDKPQPGTFQVGPYIMEGKLMFMRVPYADKSMPVLDVRIRPALPGVPWDGLQAPFALLNMEWLHGWEPAG